MMGESILGSYFPCGYEILNHYYDNPTMGFPYNDP